MNKESKYIISKRNKMQFSTGENNEDVMKL